MSRFRGVLVPVHIVDPDSMVAMPQALDPDLRSSFAPTAEDRARVEQLGPPERLRDRLERFTSAAASAAQARSEFRLHHSRCEVADQWLYTELPALAGDARESMLLDVDPDSPLRAGLHRPLASVEFELTKPLYLFEKAQIQAAAYEQPEGPAFVHRIESSKGLHATVVENFAPGWFSA